MRRLPCAKDYPMSSQLEQLRARKDSLAAQLQARLEQRRAEGHSRLTKAETRAMDEIKALCARICDIEAEAMRGGNQPGGNLYELRNRINSGGNAGRPTMSSYSNVYTKGGRANYIADLARQTLNLDGTGECRNRLLAHAEEVQRNAYQQSERRDLSRVDGEGGFFSPPAWLVDEFVEFARPGKPLANIVQQRPLPGGVDVINVPKIQTGTATAIQTADNQPVVSTDLTDTFISSPIRTIAGSQSVALQLLDQSPVDFSDVVLGDLAAAHAVNLDTQLLYGTGANGQLQGLDFTPSINTSVVGADTIQGFYNALANAYQQIVAARFRPPTHIVLHPRRFAWLLSLLDTTDRPLFVPRAQGPFNTAGLVDTPIEAEGPVGTILGLDVILDSNISVVGGTEYQSYGSEDAVIMLRASDCVLYSSGIRARVSPETLQATLTVLITLWSYEAFTVRFPGSVAIVTGFDEPVFG
jgi:HK97 family phage major capsid protein